MESYLDLNTFAKTLTGKGYDGYFHTQGVYAGKLIDSIAGYLENCRRGADKLPSGNLLLNCYLQWSGDANPRIECSMWVKHLDGKFSLDRMELVKKDSFGQLIKKAELTNISVFSAPTSFEAIALTDEEQKLRADQSHKRYKR